MSSSIARISHIVRLFFFCVYVCLFVCLFLTSGTASGAQVENYFAEQPSGRNLLHVLPSGPGAVASSGVHASGGGGGGGGGRKEGAFTEQSSGRGLVHGGPSAPEARERRSGDDDTRHHNERFQENVDSRGSSMDDDSYTEDEDGDDDDDDGSSRWNDSDAQSGYPYNTGSASAYPSSSLAPSERYRTSGGDGDGRAGLTEDDLIVSEGSDAESRVGGRHAGGSETTYGHDTAAGGSSVDDRSGRLHAREIFVHSSGSSAESRVGASLSDIGRGESRVIPGQDSWRNSGAGPAGIDRNYSGETTDSSVLMEQHQGNTVMDRGESQGDGDFGTVWLANRAHARQYEGQEERKS